MRCFCCSPENHENPFIADGELRRKADYIIQYSTISRRRIRIADPDCTPPPAPPTPPEPQRDAAVSQGDVQLCVVDVVSWSPVLSGTERRTDDDSARLTATNEDDRNDHHHHDDGPRQRTPSPTAATSSDGDVDVKTETSTVESDRPTTSLLSSVGGSTGSSQGRAGRCRCCAVQ